MRAWPFLCVNYVLQYVNGHAVKGNQFSKKYTAFFMQSLEPVHEISNNVVFATSKASDQPVHTHSLIRDFASRLSIL